MEIENSTSILEAMEIANISKRKVALKMGVSPADVSVALNDEFIREIRSTAILMINEVAQKLSGGMSETSVA